MTNHLKFLILLFAMSFLSCKGSETTTASDTPTTAFLATKSQAEFIKYMDFVMLHDDVQHHASSRTISDKQSEHDCEISGIILKTHADTEEEDANGYHILDFEFKACKFKTYLIKTGGSEHINCNSKEITINGKIRFTYNRNEKTETSSKSLTITGTQEISGIINATCNVNYKLHYDDYSPIISGTICGFDVTGLDTSGSEEMCPAFE